MARFISKEKIFQSVWHSEAVDISDSNLFPVKKHSINHKKYTFEDIETWEEIYFSPGDIGIYGAWSPFTEIYIIVFNLFVDSKLGIEIYSGEKSQHTVIRRAKELGVDITQNDYWIDNIDLPKIQEK